MSQSNKIINNSIALMGGHVYQSAIGLITIGLIARYLKPEKFGDYGFIMALCVIFSIITDMGINRISVREMSRNLSRANDILVASFLVKLLLSLITFAATALIINMLSDDKEVIIATYICVIAVTLFFIGDIFDCIFKAFEKMGYTALSAFVERTTYLLCLGVFIRMDFGLKGIFSALLFSYVTRFAFGLSITCKRFFRPRVTRDFSLCFYLLKEGFPIGINRILRKTSFRFDTILIKLMKSATQVGFFHGAYRIILALEFIPASITGAMFPMFSRLAKGSAGSIEKALEKSFKFLWIIAVPLMIFIIFFSKRIVSLVLGKSFIEVAPALQVFSLVFGLMLLSGLFIKVLNAFDKQVLAAKAVAVCLAINVGLDIILIKFFGYFGAVIATLVAEASLCVIAYRFVSRHVGLLPFSRVMPKPLLCGLPMAIACHLLTSINIVVVTIIGLAVYLCGLFILEVFEKDEIEGVKKSLQKMRESFGYHVLRDSILKSKKE